MKYPLKTIVIYLLFTSQVWGSIEGLDQIELRKSRKATNTYYHAETSTNSWSHQPESLMYLDSRTGHEVWILSNTNNETSVYYTDISPANPWSADGARLGFFSSRDVLEFDRIYGSILTGNSEASTFTVRSDGSTLRTEYGSSNRNYGTSTGQEYFYWSPVLPDVYYTTGGRSNGIMLDASAIYKNTVADTGTTFSKIADLPGADTDVYGMFKVISPDGQYLLPRKDGKYFPVRVYPESAAGPVDVDGWNEYRGQLNQFAGGDPFGCRHDLYFPSPNFIVLLYSTDCNAAWPIFYKLNLGGSDPDGGPAFDDAELTYANFGDFETEPLWNYKSPVVPWKLEPSNDKHWWGHPGFDRWGRTVTFGDGNGYTNISGSLHENGGPVTWDYKARKLEAQPLGTVYPLVNTTINASYNDHNAWSDYYAQGNVGNTADPTTTYVAIGEYNKTHLQQTGEKIAYWYGNVNASTEYSLKNASRVAQSPDGTKVSYMINYMSSDPKSGDIAYAVAYFPHPPEITEVTNVSGTYTIKFDWRLGTVNPRGYTNRGWPTEGVSQPPPPRETKSFRLWRSPTGTGDWTPVATTDSGVFDRYNFQTGAWSGNNYWTISDTPGAGTWYYAVTALEHSGLESRTLSNVFSTGNMQTAAYPANPKGSTNFTTGYIPSLVKAYNIYASDGIEPAEGRGTLIATIPASYGSSWVDWLGNVDGSTKYKVAAIDYQGKESAPLVTTYSHRATVGQYAVSWTAEIAPEPTCDVNHTNLCTEAECTWYWYDNLCHSSPEPATCDGTHLGLCTVDNCTAAGGFWYNETCNNTAEVVCSSAHKELCTVDNCTSVGLGYWYDNACHTEPAPTPGARVRYRPTGAGPTKAVDN